MSQLRQRAEEFESLGVRVVIVTFDALWLAQRYIAENPLPWPLLLDTNRELYRGYGMTRASWWALLNPTAIWKYVKLIARGHLPGRPGSDVQQLGGDVLIDPQGIIRFIHRSLGPHDRPDINELLQHVQSRQFKKNS